MGNVFLYSDSLNFHKLLLIHMINFVDKSHKPGVRVSQKCDLLRLACIDHLVLKVGICENIERAQAQWLFVPPGTIHILKKSIFISKQGAKSLENQACLVEAMGLRLTREKLFFVTLSLTWRPIIQTQHTRQHRLIAIARFYLVWSNKDRESVLKKLG